MDEELHAMGHRLLTKRLQEQEAANMLEVVPQLPGQQKPVNHQRPPLHRPGDCASSPALFA